MAAKKLILVTGATSAMGESVAKALLQTGNFAIRAFTPDARSEEALELRQLGAEIFAGNMDDETSLEAAMDGCYGVFGVTDYWEYLKKEYSLGMNLVKAAAVMGIQHLVLHTQPNYGALSGGEFEVPHFNIKAALKAYSQQLRLPATYLQVSFYYENFLDTFPPLSDQFGTFQFGFPQGHTKMAMVSVEDVGPIVTKIFSDPNSFIGRTITAVGADDTCDAYAATMTRVLGLPVHYNHIPRELYRAFRVPFAEELANMFEVQRLYIPNREKEMNESYRLHPGMQSFETWLLKNRERFLAQMHYQLLEEVMY